LTKINESYKVGQILTNWTHLMAKKHPGFKAVQAKIAAKEGVSKKEAGAMLAASTRNASAKAKKANPRLKRVK
jgi:hypothetical protein